MLLMIELTTPALLFPAITLLLLAYTNRFLAIAGLIRGLSREYRNSEERSRLEVQIQNLRRRLYLVRNMQAFGIASFFVCVLSILFLFLEEAEVGYYSFGLSLLLLLISLALSFVEIQISTKALDLDLDQNMIRKSPKGK